MTTPTYEYTKDWFSWAPELWNQLTPLLPARLTFLEIGSFEGRSTVWTLENMVADGGAIYCVDTWEGGEEHTAEDVDGSEVRFDKNIGIAHVAYPNRSIVKLKGLSTKEIPKLTTDLSRPDFDFVYIDGSHVAKDVLTDACMAWPLLKPGGVLVFDDYLWGGANDILRTPKLAIDAFVNIFLKELDIVHVGYQYVVRKKRSD